MKSIVVGYGSIGAQHSRILLEMGCPTKVVSRRNIGFSHTFSSIEKALEGEKVELVVVASKTKEHLRDLHTLKESGYNGFILIEKPLFQNYTEISEKYFNQIFVAYNLRFHPVVQKLRQCLTSEKIISVQVYVGSYLPQWRPNRDYRKGFSAKKAEGGGVLRELSHELDYLNWLLNGWTGLFASGGHYSSLEIDSDDVFGILMSFNRCPIVTLQMNFIDRIGHRQMIINTDQHTFHADLIKGTLQIDEQIEICEIEQDMTYRYQLEALKNKDFQNLCTFEEGNEVMQMIKAVENSESTHQWIVR